MRKRIISPAAPEVGTDAARVAWLDIAAVATVAATSEDPAYPVEGALIEGCGDGWRASTSGRQTLRIEFDAPRRLTRISIVFVEQTIARTQEFVLAWSADGREYR